MYLFKKDSSGKIRFLDIFHQYDEIVQRSGVLDSANTVEHRKTATSKNIGKINETTPAEQAILEVESTIESKLKEGYFLTVQEAESTEVILPMLAKVFEKEKHKIDWGYAFAQYKFDGMRCLAFIEDGNVTLMSRKGREITTMPHIVEALKDLPNCILDGELYCKEFGSFQNQMKAIKKYTKELSPLVEYHVYDIVKDKPYLTRYRIIFNLLQNLDKRINLVTSWNISSEKELIDFHKRAIKEGYEGSMVRWGAQGYEINKRSSSLLKYKDFLDMQLCIKDIIPSKQRPTWGQPIFELNGQEFSSGMKFSIEEKEDLLLNKEKYIGKLAELRYFELSDEGVPRFPVCVGFRED